MKTAKITTAIPTYRHPEFLKKAIQSALDQTFPDLRVLGCDNGCGNRTKEVVSSFYCVGSHVFVA